VERFCAYLVLGLLVSRAAGRKALTATVAVVVLAVALEASQRLIPGRHAALPDAMVKALGGVIGVAAHQLSFPFKRWLAPSLAPRPHPALSPAPIRVRVR
jgi:VanZ family protein